MLHVVTEQQGVLNKPTSFQMQNCALVINFKLPDNFLELKFDQSNGTRSLLGVANQRF